MMLGKLWRSLRAQLNKVANLIWTADPIAQMQYEYDLAVSQLQEGRKGLEMYRALVERVSRQVQNDKAHVNSLEAKVKAYLTAGDRETASKFALEALSMSLRAELRSTGVRVLVVRPGPVETPFHEHAKVVDENIGYRPPGHKAQSAEEVAKMTVNAVASKRTVLETSLFVKTASAAARVAPALMRRISKQMAAKSGF